jgi:hypothetical protein
MRSGSPTPPEDENQPYPTVQLDKILAVLPEAAQDQLIRILNSKIDDIAMARELKALLRRYAVQLETVGILPDYLAYMLVYMLPQLRQKSSDDSHSNN